MMKAELIHSDETKADCMQLTMIDFIFDVIDYVISNTQF